MDLGSDRLPNLYLSHCSIGDGGAEIVADFLKDDITLVNVNMGWTCLGADGAKAIAEAMEHNDTVEILNLPGNFIGDEGGEALVGALNHNTSITVLNLDFTDAAPESKAAIFYRTQTRNALLIPAAVRQASLYLIAARNDVADAGIFVLFPKEIVRMIAMEVWATRKDPVWINALSESERTGESGDE